MKQVFRKGLKEIVVDEVPAPTPIPHHVLINPVCSLISTGTETASIHNEGLVKGLVEDPSHIRKIWDAMKATGPVRTVAEVRAKFEEYAALGYAGAGFIVDRHPTVSGFTVGDRVAYGGEGTGHGETILAGQNLVVRVPDPVPFEHACFTTLGSIALNAVRISRIGVGDIVAIVGLGLVGQLVAQLARLQGARVIAIDLRSDRVELARKLEADVGLSGSFGVANQVSSITNGRGADCVIVAAASTSSAPSELALQICRDRGRLVIVGAVELNFPWQEMYMKEIKLFMSRAYGPGSYDPDYEQRGHDYPFPYVRWTEKRNMEEFLRLVETNQVRLQPLITHEFPLESAAEAYKTLMNPASNSLAVVLRYPQSETFDTPRDFKPTRRIELINEEVKANFRVALVGAGNLARWAHLPSLKKIPDVRLHAVLSTSGARGNTYARRFGAKYFCSDYDEILNDPEIDVVLILSRNQSHFSQALAALSAGKHVFVEKPMALTVEECQKLYRVVEETGKHLTVGFNRRFAPFYVEQKGIVSNRTSPAVINCRVNSPGISGSYWMADPAIGGAILGEAVHFIDLMYWLLESEPVSVSSYSLPTGNLDPIGENNLVTNVIFADGSIGSLNYSTLGAKNGGERVEIFADGTTSIVEDFKRLRISSNLIKTRASIWPRKGYEAQLRSFFSRLGKGLPPEVNVRDGARATIACVRMLESAQTRSPREIHLDEILNEPPSQL